MQRSEDLFEKYIGKADSHFAVLFSDSNNAEIPSMLDCALSRWAERSLNLNAAIAILRHLVQAALDNCCQMQLLGNSFRTHIVAPMWQDSEP